MTQALVLLFDIDGTLLKATGAGRRALNRAFHQIFGVDGVIDPIELQGMTDPLILKAGLSTLGQPNHPDTQKQLLSYYLGYLNEELAKPNSTLLLPGVIELLNRLQRAEAPTAIGLGTGNVEAGAKAKLSQVGLTHYFGFGGYGSDHELRSEVLRIGAERGARQLRRAIEDCRTLVIGDTRRGIDAARAIGAECLAVATGDFSVTELLSYGATYATQTLADPAVYRLLVAGSPASPS